MTDAKPQPKKSPFARLAWIKHLLLAASAAAFLICALEVGLRAYDSWRGGSPAELQDNKSLLAKSWSVHHCLKPLKGQDVRNPDTAATVSLRTNSLGLRGADVVQPKPPGVFRVVCLGDEIVFAPDVDEARTFVKRLESHLQQQTAARVEVINAGVPAYCPLLSALQFRQSLLGLQPDLVICHFDMSDVADDYRYRRHTRIGPGGVPMSCAHPDFERLVADSEKSGWSKFVLVRRLKGQMGILSEEKPRPKDRTSIDSPKAKYAWLTGDAADWDVYITQALSPLDWMNTFARQSGMKFVVSVVPAPWQIAATASDGPGVRAAVGVPSKKLFPDRKPFERIIRYCDEQGITWHDVSPRFLKAESPANLYLNNAARFSDAGHELYARELTRFVLRAAPELQSPSARPSTQPAPVIGVRSRERRVQEARR